jgi:hypothetical protein
MPNHIPRVGFPTLYHNVTTQLFQSIQGSGLTTVERTPQQSISPKKRDELRQRFYQRHRKSLRQAYLLSEPKTINYSILDNVTIDDHPFVNGFSESELLDESSVKTLNWFLVYVERRLQSHMLGCKLLLHSTYATDNPLMFTTEYIYKKRSNTLIRSSGQFTRFGSGPSLFFALLQNTPTLFMKPDRVETTLTQMFSNPLALHRSIAYNANKAIMVHLLTEETYQQKHMYDIWSRFKYDLNPERYQRAFVKAIQENFVTRKQFENYLLALSAGKVGEHLMLFYREALPQFNPLKPRFGRYTYDVSEIGREELHQMTWLLNIMIEKNLFYTPSVDLSKQVLASENKGRVTAKHDSSIVAIAANKERWREFDLNTHRLATQFDQNKMAKKFISLFVSTKRTYWWEPNGLDLPSLDSLNSIKEWTTLFSTKKQSYRIQRMPADLNYDTYRPNVLRTSSLLDEPFDAKYLPTSFVESATKQGDNWNQACLSHTERLSRALLLDTFAKSFYVLASQRELCDYVSYYLVRFGQVQADQLKELSQTFLEPVQRERLEQIEKDKDIDEQIDQVQKKKPE